MQTSKNKFDLLMFLNKRKISTFSFLQEKNLLDLPLDSVVTHLESLGFIVTNYMKININTALTQHKQTDVLQEVQPETEELSTNLEDQQELETEDQQELKENKSKRKSSSGKQKTSDSSKHSDE